MSLYELAVLGGATSEQRIALTATIDAMISDFGLSLDNDVRIHDASSVANRDMGAAFAAAYFGHLGEPDLAAATAVLNSRAPIIPIVSHDGNFAEQIPKILSSANGMKLRRDDPKMTEVATALLECVGLLRRQRRVFVSYRRTESRTAALQLHDVLAARGFDVFLDTHSIRPGDPFQDVLWHRLVDSDVLVMLDTPTYFESRWTRQEIGRARAKEIHVLRVIWPEHLPTKMSEFGDSMYLTKEQLLGPDGPVDADTADAIALRVERLRSRSIAARYMSMTGKLKADVEKIGAEILGIGAHRAITVRLVDGTIIWAYPVVGVPTAETLHDVSEKASRSDINESPVLVYDHVGIRDAWKKHLLWLDEHIAVVRSIRVSEAGWTLAAWEGSNG